MQKSEERERYRWVILAIVYLSMLTFAFAFHSIPPVLPFIMSELHITYAQSGLLMSFFALPGLFFSLLGGILSDRYGIKSFGAGCFLFMMGGAFLVGFGRDLSVLWLGRIIAGVGAFALVILLPKIISQWFRDKELGLAMGVFNTVVPLGAAVCFLLFGRMGRLWGWRFPILLTGIYALIVSILFLSFYRSPLPQKIEMEKPLGIYRSLKKMRSTVWWLGLCWLSFNAASISFSTFTPDFFLRKGYTIEQGGFLIGIPLLGTLLLSIPVGYVIDRFRHEEWLIGIGGLALTCVTFFFNFSSFFLLLVILMGLFAALIPTSIFSLPPKILRPENLGLGFGIVSTCSSIGSFIAPYLVGKAEDLTGSYHWRFILIPLFYLLIMVSVFFAHRSRTKMKFLSSGHNIEKSGG